MPLGVTLVECGGSTPLFFREARFAVLASHHVRRVWGQTSGSSTTTTIAVTFTNSLPFPNHFRLCVMSPTAGSLFKEIGRLLKEI
jgi:hypothetical protein